MSSNLPSLDISPVFFANMYRDTTRDRCIYVCRGWSFLFIKFPVTLIVKLEAHVCGYASRVEFDIIRMLRHITNMIDDRRRYDKAFKIKSLNELVVDLCIDRVRAASVMSFKKVDELWNGSFMKGIRNCTISSARKEYAMFDFLYLFSFRFGFIYVKNFISRVFVRTVFLGKT